MDIRNQTAIVTGGASGLGAATAKALALAGAKVIILDNNIELGEKTAEEFSAFAIKCDVSNETSVEQALSILKQRFGLPRVLVNCAGIGGSARIVGKNGPLALDDFERVIRVNLIGTFNMIRLVAAEIMQAEPMDDQERGVIISTSSVAAFEGQIGQAAYAASKGGITSLTLPAAREFAQFGIRVNTIAPGLFMTPLLDGLSEEAQKSLAASIPFPKRLGGAEEFADLVLHLIQNRYINGEVIRIDGALRMQPK
ncbi:MAG TPA: SDR family NAD(P)-dependent oxidoreductase [Chryseolinea sp.]|nr:SDR family NAD(P)-dependent oxidoreductase [Chryseolinea sp.]